MSFNRLADRASLFAVAPCRALRKLQMNDNPLSDEAGYRKLALAVLPWLRDLDGQLIERADVASALDSALRQQPESMLKVHVIITDMLA